MYAGLAGALILLSVGILMAHAWRPFAGVRKPSTRRNAQANSSAPASVNFT
jgi:hypothetical protein